MFTRRSRLCSGLKFGFHLNRSSKKERGSALIFVLIISVLLLGMGLGITFISLNEFQVSKELEKHQIALMVAEAGLNQARQSLRKISLDTAIDQLTQVPAYLPVEDPAQGSYASRNPLPIVEAKFINFDTPPTAVGTRTVSGLLSSPLGESIGRGRYFAKITKVTRPASGAFNLIHEPQRDGLANRDALFLASALPELPDWAISNRFPWIGPVALFADGEDDRGDDNGDGGINPGGNDAAGGGAHSGGSGSGDDATESETFYVIRVVGIHPIVPNEIATTRGNARNSVAIIEARVSRDSVFGFGAPISLIGPDTDSNFAGNAFNIRGDETHAGISFLNDNPSGQDARASLLSLHADLSHQQYDNITGATDGPYGGEPSLRDDTATVRNDPDAAKILDPNYLNDLVEALTKMADIHYTEDSTHLAGQVTQLGSADDPKITVVEGDLILTGSGYGSGILVVKGDFDYRGAFDYDGLVLVLGEGAAHFRGANKSLTGGLVLANLTEQAPSSYSLGNTVLELNGNSNLIFDGDKIRMSLDLLPLKTTSWREITAEIEPAE